MKINFEGDKLEKQNVESLVKPYLDRHQILEYEIKELEEQLKERKAACKEIIEYLIPSILEENDITEVRFKDETKVTLKKEYYATFPKNKQEKLSRWLQDHSLYDIVSTEITLDFGKGNMKDVVECCQYLEEDGYEPCIEEKIHSSTLKAFVRERMENKKKIEDSYTMAKNRSPYQENQPTLDFLQYAASLGYSADVTFNSEDWGVFTRKIARVRK